MSRLILESEALRVVVNPDVGGTITSIEHKTLGLSVLGTTPWDVIDAPLDSLAALDERTWLTRYSGGWPLLFPNAGDACSFAGTFHGFHGEASIAPWRAEAGTSSILLARRFFTVPARMQRELSVQHDVLDIRETVQCDGQEAIKFMWGQHPTFGSDLLDGEFEIQTSARCVLADHAYDPPTNPLRPGASGQWPIVPGKAGLYDLSRPAQCGQPQTMASLAFLRDFDDAWITIRRLDDAIAVALTWDATLFPYAWLWCELGGTSTAPWFGRAKLIGLEPNTTCSANGLADAAQRGERLLTLEPGTAISTVVRLHVFKPDNESKRWELAAAPHERFKIFAAPSPGAARRSR